MWSDYLLLLLMLLLTVVRGSGTQTGAGHYGVGEAGERSGGLSPGRHALSPGLFLGQKCRRGLFFSSCRGRCWGNLYRSRDEYLMIIMMIFTGV